MRSGDTAARNRLAARYLSTLRRWAHGRIPPYARDLADTDDLVQVAVLRALEKVETFEPRREGAFLAYLRRILLNQIRDQIRRAAARPRREELDERVEASEESPLERAIGSDILKAYETALSKLPEEQREAVMLRIELGYTFPEIAEAIGSPSPNAVRMMITRALVRMSERMDGR